MTLPGVCLAASTALADNWDLARNSLRLGVADADWTVVEQYQGVKLLLDAHLVFQRDNHLSNHVTEEQHMKYLFDAHLQFGHYKNALDYAMIGYTYRGYQRKRELESSRKFQNVRDQMELGRFVFGYDDTLNIDYYAEIAAGRIGQFWAYRHSDNSPFKLTLGINASLGWAWTESVDRRYAPVSNPVMGIWTILALDHERFGQLYFDRFTNNGFNIGDPAQTNSRQARIRFGYRKEVSRCMALDIFMEKRSMLYAAFDMPDLYDKTQRVGIDLVCQFQ